MPGTEGGEEVSEEGCKCLPRSPYIHRRPREGAREVLPHLAIPFKDVGGRLTHVVSPCPRRPSPSSNWHTSAVFPKHGQGAFQFSPSLMWTQESKCFPTFVRDIGQNYGVNVCSCSECPYHMNRIINSVYPNLSK